MIGFGAIKSLGFVPYLIGGAILFYAGGEIIGGYKVSKAQAASQSIRNQIVANAVQQAEGLAKQWEEENAKSRAFKREIDRLRGTLQATEREVDNATTLRQDELALASSKLSQCLMDQDAVTILNDWMTNETPLVFDERAGS